MDERGDGITAGGGAESIAEDDALEAEINDILEAETAAVDNELAGEPELFLERDDELLNDDGGDSRIGSAMVIRGRISGRRGVLVSGRIEGEVSCPRVEVAAEAALHGRLECAEFELCGLFDGDAVVKSFHLCSSGRQRGVTEAQQLLLDAGGRFDCLAPAPGWEDFVPEINPLPGARSLDELLAASEVVVVPPGEEGVPEQQWPGSAPVPADEPPAVSAADAEDDLLDSNPFADLIGRVPGVKEASEKRQTGGIVSGVSPADADAEESQTERRKRRLPESDDAAVSAEPPVVAAEPPVELDFSSSPQQSGEEEYYEEYQQAEYQAEEYQEGEYYEEYEQEEEQEAYDEKSAEVSGQDHAAGDYPLTTGDGVPVAPLAMLLRQIYSLLEAEKPLIRVSGRLDSGVAIPGARLLAGLPKRYRVIEMKHPEGSTRQLLATLFLKLGCGDAEALHLPTGQLVGAIRKELQRLRRLRRRVVLVVDDAEKMYQTGMERLVQLLTFAFVEEGDVDLPEDAGFLQLLLFSGDPLDHRLVYSIAEYFAVEWECSLFFSADAEAGMPIPNEPPSAQVPWE